MTNETKVMIGILAATVVIVVGGAFWAGGRQAAPAANEPVAEAERLVNDNDPAYAKATAGEARQFADVKVTLVEFGDYQCPACAAAQAVVEQLKRANTDKSVRFVYRQFPLVDIHEHAAVAAEAALAAHAQGKFWEYHDVLFTNQSKLARDDLIDHARAVGLDLDQFTRALDEGAFKDMVRQGQTDGNIVGVAGTPTFFINGKLYRGQNTAAALQTAIDAALSQ